MQKAILTLSKNTSLIEMIRSNLEEGGRYYVQGVTSAHGSLAMVRHRLFDVAILDLAESDLTAAQLVYNLKKIQPEIKVLIYSPNSDDLPTEISELPIDGILRKPFFAPELSDILKNLFSSSNPDALDFDAESLQKSIATNWEEVPEDSLEEMTRLLAKTSAISCMIFHKGDLMSQSTGMSSAESQRVIDYIGENWKAFKNCEICRFMRAEGEYGAHLVYALSLGADTLLVFTYPALVELHKVRRETSKVRDAYMIGRYSKPKNGDAGFTLSVAQLFDQDGMPMQDSSAGFTDFEVATKTLGDPSSQWILEFSDMESPAEHAHFERSQAPLADTQPVRVIDFTRSKPEESAVMDVELASKAPSRDKEEPASMPGESAAQAIVQPLPEETQLVYHCLITPRDPARFLTRKLGEDSAALIHATHQDQGWKLTHLTVRPQYALWTVCLPACTSPAKVVELIKAATSDQLKASFSDQGDLSESFWAPEYWILSGHQPPSGRLIQQFLKFRSQKRSDPPNAE